jgi:tetratricopeptide (TPR) repeat protein
MRKDNALFFVAGLVFGVLTGYFVFQTLQSGSPPVAATAPAPPAAGPSVQPRVTLNPGEMAALEKRAAENPQDVEVRVLIGNRYMDAERYEEAVRWLREAKERRPSDLHLRSHLALCLENLNRVEEAAAEYQAALAIDPAYPEGLLGLGRLKLYRQRDIAEGLALWEKLVEVAPQSEAARSIREELAALKSAHSRS